jgi:hypothetical protein
MFAYRIFAYRMFASKPLLIESNVISITTQHLHLVFIFFIHVCISIFLYFKLFSLVYSLHIGNIILYNDGGWSKNPINCSKPFFNTVVVNDARIPKIVASLNYKVLMYDVRI